MKKSFVIPLALALFAAAVPGRAGIDFTLGSRPTGAGAPDPENRFISDGDSHIYLRIPAGWEATSNSAKLELIPDVSSSQVQISQVHGPQALPLDPPGLDALRKSAQAALPEGSKDVKAAGEANDLLPIFGWKSFEVTFEYEFYGQQMRQSTLYVNMIPGRVVRVNVTALATDFDKVHEKMRKLMYGWFEPSRDLSPEEARQYESGEFKGG